MTRAEAKQLAVSTTLLAEQALRPLLRHPDVTFAVYQEETRRLGEALEQTITQYLEGMGVRVP